MSVLSDTHTYLQIWLKQYTYIHTIMISLLGEDLPLINITELLTAKSKQTVSHDISEQVEALLELWNF